MIRIPSGHTPGKTRRLPDMAAVFFRLVGGSVILILTGILLLLVTESLPFFANSPAADFLTGERWNPTSAQPGYGILSLIAGTLITTLGAMLIAVPLGIMAALWLTEAARPAVREWVKPAIELLSAVPSVVIGFLGITLLAPAVAALSGRPNGLNAASGSVLLAIMALPTIISMTEDALRSVPASLREASLALGASRWETMTRVVLPAARPGVFAAVMLGLGRAIGETMTVLMIAGNTPSVPGSFFDPVRTLTATIAIELGEVPMGSVHYHALFAVGLALFVITFLINLAADLVMRRQARLLAPRREKQS